MLRPLDRQPLELPPLRGFEGLLRSLLGLSFTAFEPKIIRRLHSTCLSALATDRAMEAWYHRSIA